MNGLYESRNDPSGFKNNIRDFLVQSKEFSAQVINLPFAKLFTLVVRTQNQEA